jgi:hypothetical protein
MMELEKKEKLKGQIRALMAAAGGVLVTLGVADDTESVAVATEAAMASYEAWGGVLLLVWTAVWSWLSKKGVVKR